jgi:hypothetical protein
MRRGLMSWSKKELPPAVLAARIKQLREAMQAADLDAFVAYTNFTRPATVAHFTVFTPYWTDGLLVVPREGPTTLAVALSNRMKNWIDSTSAVDTILCGPRPGQMAAAALKDLAPKRIGIVELDQLPSGVARDLKDGLGRASFIDVTVLASALRDKADKAEIGLAQHAAALAADALEAGLSAGEEEAGALLGEIERQARLGGAEEIYLAAAADLGSDWRFSRITQATPLATRFAVRATLAYKGAWIRLIRTIDRSPSGWESAGAAATKFHQALSGLRPGHEIGESLAAGLKGLEDWTAETSTGTQPLQVVSSAKWRPYLEPEPQALLVVTARLLLKQGPWIGAAPVLVGEGKAAARVLPAR